MIGKGVENQRCTASELFTVAMHAQHRLFLCAMISTISSNHKTMC